MKFIRAAAVLLTVGLTASPAFAGYRIYEAEENFIRCEAGSENADNMWASGEKVTPAFWGRAEGDAVGWVVNLDSPVEGLTLLVRYSYAQDEYLGYAHEDNPDRALALVLNGEKIADVHVPDTGSWDLFETVEVELPPLPVGRNAFAILSTTPHTVANLDCVIIVRGDVDEVPIPLQRVHLAETESGALFLRATPNATISAPLDSIIAEVERIHDHLEATLGYRRPGAFGINVVERERWHSDASAYQQGNHLFFPDDTFWSDKGNLLHESQHLFQPTSLPRWMDEPYVQALTIFDWGPTLYPAKHGPDNAGFQQSQREARTLLDDPSATTGSIFHVLYAIRVRHGSEVLIRFAAICTAALEREEINSGIPLTKAQAVNFMSQAAGTDVEPLFQQWTEFENVE